VKYLLEHGAKITERPNDGDTPLLLAASTGSLNMYKYLLYLEGGVSISEADNVGNTALLLATSSRPQMIQWLVEYGGAQVNKTNDDGDSVWTYRAQHGLQGMVKRAYPEDDDGQYFPHKISTCAGLYATRHVAAR
jgi:ankyrin repeat protein